MLSDSLGAIFFFSVVYWIGDLNYRLNDIGNDEAKALIEVQAFDKLMQYDQVRLGSFLFIMRL